jgi:predicted nucleic-acid-binding Zn-ribbon protein
METACPKCGSHDLHAEKRGFDASGYASDSGLHLGNSLTREIDRGNQIIITCLACGHQFYPGKDRLPVNVGKPEWQYKLVRITLYVVGSIFILMSLPIFYDNVTTGVFLLVLGIFTTFMAPRYKKPKILN